MGSKSNRAQARNESPNLSADLKRLLELRERGESNLTKPEVLEMCRLDTAARKAQQDGILRPTCCKMAQAYPVVTFHVDTYDCKDTNVALGRWRAHMPSELSSDLISSNGINWLRDQPSPKFCPFCAARLPKMRRKDQVPKDVCRFTDGGYYCDTCKERLHACICLPLAAAWEPIGRDPHCDVHNYLMPDGHCTCNPKVD